jgi:hypothetical protein
MPMPKTLQCPKCERKFAREGHLARHMNSIHGAGGPMRKKKMKRKGRIGRPPGSGKKKGRVGRPPGSGKKSSRSSGAMGAMSLEQLMSLITDGRTEVQRRWKDLKKLFKNM